MGGAIRLLGIALAVQLAEYAEVGHAEGQKQDDEQTQGQGGAAGMALPLGQVDGAFGGVFGRFGTGGSSAGVQFHGVTSFVLQGAADGAGIEIGLIGAMPSGSGGRSDRAYLQIRELADGIVYLCDGRAAAAEVDAGRVFSRLL